MKHYNISKNALDQLPCAVGFKDRNSVYLAANQQLTTLMGYMEPKDVLGLRDQDIKTEMSELAEQFIQQDQEVMNAGKQQHLDIGHYANGRLQIHLSTKQVLRDDNNQIIGTVFSCVELSPSILKNIYQLLTQNHKPKFFAISGAYKQYKLSRRESECLFYLTRGFTAKDIARQLHLSPKTIEYYTEQLKNKLGCSNKPELIEKAIHLGFVFNIPLSLFPDFL